MLEFMSFRTVSAAVIPIALALLALAACQVNVVKGADKGNGSYPGPPQSEKPQSGKQ